VTERQWGGVLIFVLFGALLAFGLVTGEMPAKYTPCADRELNPVSYWTHGAVYAFGVASGLWVVFSGFLRG
jgi:hypothetical protein